MLHQMLIPGVPMIDHRDGNGLNNRRGNLREADKSQNNANSPGRRSRTSKYKGVGLRYGKWRTTPKHWMAKITWHGHTKYLGYHYTEEAAAKAYDQAAKELHGEFAWLNFPEHKT